MKIIMETRLFKLQYAFCLLKSYFEKGFALLNFPTKALMVIGIGAVAQDYPLGRVIVLSLIYGIFCFILGWLWFKWNFIVAETEVSNQYNLFVREMRKKIKQKNI